MTASVKGYVHIEHVDVDCSLHPRCLECPEPICRYDTGGGLRSLRSLNRRARFLALRRSGRSVEEMARSTGLHKCSIYRLLQQSP
jgi:hypothetical protein